MSYPFLKICDDNLISFMQDFSAIIGNGVNFVLHFYASGISLADDNAGATDHGINLLPTGISQEGFSNRVANEATPTCEVECYPNTEKDEEDKNRPLSR